MSKSDGSTERHCFWPGPAAIEPMRESPLPIPGYIAVILLLVITLGINIVGIKWGLPNNVPWNSDSIAGFKTVRMLPRLYKSWRMQDERGNLLIDQQGRPIIERYPRGQFLITGTIYKRFIEYWKQHPVQMQDPQTGRLISTWQSLERISTLILASRIVTVIMAVGTVLGVMATVRLITGDTLAGFLAAVVVMLSAEFTYFSHLGNLDTPVTFWFVWTAFFTVCALQGGKWRYFVLLGLFAGMVVCTKDPSIGHLAGLGVFVFAAAVYYHYKQRGRVVDIYKATIEARLWISLACFAAVFVVMNNVLTDWAAFSTRMQHWVGVKHEYVGSAGQQWRLVRSAVACIRKDCGLWMFIAIICSFFYCLIRHPVKCLWAVGPFVMFHIMITIQALQVQPRYHLPSLTSLAILFGIAASDLLRSRRGMMIVRAAPLVFVIVLAGMYAVSIDAEMLCESRYKAEKWVRENFDPKRDSFTFVSPSISMPRSVHDGFRVRYSFSNMTTEKSIAHRPRLIALSDDWYNDRLHFDRQFRKQLLGGELGYRKIAEFPAKYIIPGEGPFAVATIMTYKRHLSPKIVFMERVD